MSTTDNGRFKIRTDHKLYVIGHAYSLKPIEACGIIASDGYLGGPNSRLIRMNNVAEDWGTSFEFEPEQQMAVWQDVEDRGEVIAAVYHSHTKHSAVPSRRDIEGAAALDVATTHIIVSVLYTEPQIHAWTISPDGHYTEMPMEEICQ